MNDHVQNNQDTARKKDTICAASLGGVKDEKLVGMIINPEKMSEIVTKAFSMLGVPNDAIRCVKCAVDADKKPHLIAEVNYKALRQKKLQQQQKKAWYEYSDAPSENKTEGNGIAPFVYTGLANVAYPANRKLQWTVVSHNDKKYARIEFDPMLFIACAYDINFADRYYKISPVPVRYPSQNELDEKSGRERKDILRRISEFKNENLHEALFVVTYSKNWTWKLPDGSLTTGFHDTQVEYWYPPEKKKKKKHHHDDDDD